MKPNLTLFSDCDFFAGCENIISIILNSEQINEAYDLRFIYRFSKDYEQGLFARLSFLRGLSRIYLMVLNRASLPKNIQHIFIVRLLWRAFSMLTSPIQIFYNFIIIFFKLFFIKRKNILYVNNGGYPASRNALIAVLLGRLLGFNSIFLSCNNVPQRRSRFYPISLIQKFIDRKIDLSTTSVIVASDHNKENLVHYRDFSPKKIIVIPNGVDKSRFDKKKILSSREKVYFSDSIINFGIIGVHEERKGHAFLLKAIENIKQNGYQDFKLLIEGKGDLTEDLISYVRLNELEDVVEFVNDKDISSVYMNIDVLLVPSLHSEDLPNVISEAMLFGIPSVGSDLAGIPSQIDNEANGLIFEVGNLKSLTSSIRKILDNKDVLYQYKINCVSRYKSHFSSDIYLHNLKKLLGVKNEELL